MRKVEHRPRSMMEAGEEAPRKSVTCRSCGGTNVHRSRATPDWAKRPRRFLPVRHWRCHDCQHRTLRLDWPRARDLVVQVAFWVVAGAAAWWVYRILH